MSILQIIILIIISFTASRTLLRFNDKSIGYGEFIFWTFIWTTILVLAVKPYLSDTIAQALGVQRGTDIMFFFGTIVLFYLIFRLYVKLDSLDRHLTELNSNTSKAIHKLKK